MKPRLLVSAYRCNPVGVSEAYSSYKWAEILSSVYEVEIATTEGSAREIEAYWERDPCTRPVDTKVLSIRIPRWMEDRGRVRRALKPGYFLFDLLLHRHLRAQMRRGDRPALILRRSPVAARFPTLLGSLGVPLIVGPISGGLDIPVEMKSMRRSESLLYKLRALDRVLLSIPAYASYLDEAVVVLVSGAYVRERLPLRVRGKCEVVFETGVEVGHPPAPTRERELGETTCVWVGRMTAYKGPTFAIRAFAHWKSTRSGARGRLLMVGDGEERTTCERLVKQLGLESSVVFLGWVSRDEVGRLISEADVMLFPSVKEAAGNVYLEALSRGVPVVGVARGGAVDAVGPGCGILVEPGSEDELIHRLAVALGELVGCDGVDYATRFSCYEYARAHFSWEALERSILTVMDPGRYRLSPEAGSNG